MRPAAKSGYTIIEVMIVLAISTTLMVAAIAVFKGQQGETQFGQAVQDLNSKIINYADQVSAGTFPDSENYSCAGGGASPPMLSVSSGSLGGRQGCIFLGRAVQVKQDSSTITFYTVVGNREDTSSGDAVTDITQAHPTATTVTVSGNLSFILTDSYNLSGDTTIKSAQAYDSSGFLLSNSWYMAGLYISLDANSSDSSGTTQLDLWGYNLPDNTAPQTASIKSCIEDKPPCTSSYQQISKWVLCIQNSDKNKTFALSIRGTTNGLTTNLTDVVC